MVEEPRNTVWENYTDRPTLPKKCVAPPAKPTLRERGQSVKAALSMTRSIQPVLDAQAGPLPEVAQISREDDRVEAEGHARDAQVWRAEA